MSETSRRYFDGGLKESRDEHERKFAILSPRIKLLASFDPRESIKSSLVHISQIKTNRRIDSIYSWILSVAAFSQDSHIESELCVDVGCCL